MALTASADLRIAVYVLSSFIICCVCLCVVFVFYRYCLGDMKQVMHIQNEVMGDTAAMHKDVQTNVVPVNSGGWTVPQAEIDFERDLVVQWLRHTVKLPQYTQNLFNEGYDNMRAVQAINSRQELARCGIKPSGHQTLILSEIAGLQGTQFGTKQGGLTHGEGGGQANNSNASNVFGQLPPPPPPMMGTNYGDGLEYGAEPNNTYYEVNGEGGLVGHGRQDDSDEDLFETNYVQATVTHAVPPDAVGSPVLNTPLGGPPPPMMQAMNNQMMAMHQQMMNNPMMAPPPPPQVNVTANGLEPVYSDPDSWEDDANHLAYGQAFGVDNEYQVTVEGDY
eukprot:108702_1